MDWYRIADAKGQLLLTLDGVLITVVSGIVLGQPAEVGERLRQFGPETWLFLTISAIFIFLSIVSAALCLWSRSGLGSASIRRLIQRLGVNPNQKETYTAQIAWWFGMIAVLEPRHIHGLIQEANEEFERDALAFQIVALSNNVLKKHGWVNRGWALRDRNAISLPLLGRPG